MSAKVEFPEKYVRVIYDFSYSASDGRQINIAKDERFLLIQKTNKDWWKVIRGGERRAFYAPANYLEEIAPVVAVEATEPSTPTSSETNFRKRSNSEDVKGLSDRHRARSLEFLSPRAENSILQSCENLNTLSSNGSSGRHRKIRLARDSWDRRKSWAMSLDESEFCDNDLVSLTNVAEPSPVRRTTIAQEVPTRSTEPPPLPPKTKSGSFSRPKAAPPLLPPRAETTRLHSVPVEKKAEEVSTSKVQNLRRNYENVEFNKRSSTSETGLGSENVSRARDEWEEREKTSLGSFRSRNESGETAPAWRRKSRNSLDNFSQLPSSDSSKVKSDSQMAPAAGASKPVPMAFNNPLYSSAPIKAKVSPSNVTLARSPVGREDSNVIKLEVVSPMKLEFGSYRDSSVIKIGKTVFTQTMDTKMTTF
jgi:hypothetical protein